MLLAVFDAYFERTHVVPALVTGELADPYDPGGPAGTAGSGDDSIAGREQGEDEGNGHRA
jgi:hypothetical protein